jgi:hypothetical protein
MNPEWQVPLTLWHYQQASAQACETVTNLIDLPESLPITLSWVYILK